MASPRSPLDQYYGSSSSPWTRRSSAASSLYGGSPLLSSPRRISIRTPNLGSPNPGGPAALLRLRGRWRKGLAALALVLLLGGVLYLATDSSSLGEGRSATRFMRVGGFGLDYMGREEAALAAAAAAAASASASASASAAEDTTAGEGTSKLCLLFPWRKECAAEAAARKDPFEGLRFRERAGQLFYPALRGRGGSRAPLRPGQRPPPPADVELQPHAIHHLVRQARRKWKARVARQSRSLEQAIDEYERRYGRRPPRGFGEWFAFAREKGFVMVDEFDAMMDRVELFLAVKPSNLARRHDKLQFDGDFWLQDKAFTVELKQRGAHIEAHGPMKGANERTEQMLKLLGGIAKRLPDMNVTFTGHDVPWVVLSGEARDRHRKAARDGVLLSDEEADDYVDDWKYDGWAQVCPPNSPLRRAPAFDERIKLGQIYDEPQERSFIKNHVQAMDLCSHPETQLIHGFTAWSGPRPGLLYPIFVSTMTSMHSDLLIPPIDQYDRALGRDPAWEDKKHNKVVWRGSTTGADLNVEHMRKWSQRPRLCRLPFESGEVTVPLAASDTSTALGPVTSLVARKQALAQRYFDFQFLGTAQQCDDPKVCAEFEKDFLWSDWVDPDEQNEYKYMLDVDGNGWSGRFHRLMSTNSLVLKSTIFPEWYSGMIQPWVHYVPVQTDYSDLYPIMAFFLGDEAGKGGHDALAKEIATEGKKWAEAHWRWADMEVYMYRLLLEYNRIMNRDEQNPTSLDM